MWLLRQNSCTQNVHMTVHVESVHEKKKLWNVNFVTTDLVIKRLSWPGIHILSVYENGKPLKCEFCNYNCTQKVHSTKNVESVHEEKTIQNVKGLSSKPSGDYIVAPIFCLLS